VSSSGTVLDQYVAYNLGGTPLEMLVDPALVGKRVRVTIEALPDENIAAKEVVAGN